MELDHVLGHEIIATDRGLRGQPPDPVPEVVVDGRQRFLTGRPRGHGVLRLLQEQVFNLGGTPQQDLVDGKVTHRLPLLAEWAQRRDERRQITREGAEVRGIDGEIPVGELIVRSPGP
jgi:hypothetical protein